MTQEKRRQTQVVKPLPGLKLIGLVLRILGKAAPDMASRLALFLYTFPGRKAVHFRQDELLLSARRSSILSGRNRIRVYEWGNGPRRILLLHGWQSRGTALRYFVPTLTDRGCRVVAMDAPGHGESSGWRTTLINYAQSIREVDQAFGPFESAITHSFGGRALTFALAFEPHQWAVERIVMLSAPTSFEEIMDTFMDRMKLPGSLKSAVVKRMTYLLGRPVNETEIFQLGDRIQARILLIHDEQDEIVPMWEAERIASRLPGVRLIKTRGFGHYRMAKDPEIWEIVRTFLLQGKTV